MLLLSVSYNIYIYIFFIFFFCITVQYCNRIIILYVTDIFYCTLLQFFFDFYVHFQNVVTMLRYNYFTLNLL